MPEPLAVTYAELDVPAGGVVVLTLPDGRTVSVMYYGLSPFGRGDDATLSFAAVASVPIYRDERSRRPEKLAFILDRAKRAAELAKVVRRGE